MGALQRFMQERPPRVRDRLQEPVRSSIRCGVVPSTLHDKRSAIDVLIISGVHEENWLYDTLGAHRTAIGRRSYERTRGEAVDVYVEV